MCFHYFETVNNFKRILNSIDLRFDRTGGEMKIFLVYLRIHSHHGSGDYYNYGLGYIGAVLKSKGMKLIYVVQRTPGRSLIVFYEKVKFVTRKLSAFP